MVIDMANTRNITSPKRKLIDDGAEERKVVPCTRQGILLDKKALDYIKYYAKNSASEVIQALKILTDYWCVPLTLPIIDACIKAGNEAHNLTERIAALHEEGVAITGEILKVFTAPGYNFNAHITQAMLLDLHKHQVELSDDIVIKGVAAVRLELQDEYILAILTLHYCQMLNSSSISVLSPNLPWNDAYNLITESEAENRVTQRFFNNPAAVTDALPLPAVLTSVISTFFSPLRISTRDQEILNSYGSTPSLGQ